MNGKKLVLVVACALVDSDGRVLIAQRPQGKAQAVVFGKRLRQYRRTRVNKTHKNESTNRVTQTTKLHAARHRESTPPQL